MTISTCPRSHCSGNTRSQATLPQYASACSACLAEIFRSSEVIAVRHVRTILRNPISPRNRGVCVHADSKQRVLAMTCGFQSVSSTRDFNLFRKQGAAGSPQFCCQRRRLWILREADWDANLCTCRCFCKCFCK